MGAPTFTSRVLLTIWACRCLFIDPHHGEFTDHFTRHTNQTTGKRMETGTTALNPTSPTANTA